MSTTRVLIVGLVRGAAWAREIRKVPELAIAGLVDVDPERLATVGAEVGVVADRQYRVYEEALSRAGADLVVLAVPAPLHKVMSLQGLETGHHVICEKPLAMSLDEAREIREAVRKIDRRFMVGEQYRFADGVENLRRAIAAGRIGPVAYMSHDFYRGAQLSVGRWARGDHWSQAYREPALHDMSVHHFDMWYYITGSPCVEIYCKLFDVAWNPSPRTFGYSAHATLASGVHVDYLTCRALARPQTHWYGMLWIVGQGGALFWDGDSAVVSLSRVVPGDNVFDQSLATEPVCYVDRGISGTNAPLVPLIRALLDAIREDRPHPCDVDDNLVSFATSMAAIRSVETGKPERVSIE
jgi:predicted dehydrogenase